MSLGDENFTSSPSSRAEAGFGPLNVAQQERTPSLILGALFALFGLKQGSVLGLLLALGGGVLLYRGATGHCPCYEAMGINTFEEHDVEPKPKRVAIKPDRHERVEEASWESFPASDSPSWSGGAIT